MAVSERLGSLRPPVDTAHGPIGFRERGSGEPILFVHGYLCNGDLWRDVVPRLAERYRCITPDFPLGGHAQPARADADMTPVGLARLIREFLERLDLDDVTLVANDYGGALCQVLLAEDPSPVSRVLLTSCDSFRQLPPRYFKPLAVALRLGLGRSLFRIARRGLFQRIFWWSVAHRPPEPEILASYVGGLDDRGIVGDLIRVGREAHPRYTLRAARKLGRFEGPAIVAWAADDLWFARRNGRRLAGTFPNGRFVLVEKARTFVPEDAPERLAELVEELMLAEPHPPAQPQSTRS